MNTVYGLLPFVMWPSIQTASLSHPTASKMDRIGFLRDTALMLNAAIALVGNGATPSTAFPMPSPQWSDMDRIQTKVDSTVLGHKERPSLYTVAYRSLTIDIPGFGVKVPAAAWYPTESTRLGVVAADASKENVSSVRPITTFISIASAVAPVPESSRSTVDSAIKYSHRISVKKIGQLLAGWDFIPEFVSKDYSLTPMLNDSAGDGSISEFVVDGEDVSLPKCGPVVLLAHGYLGSRYDLSHLAEKLAQQGFTCISPEYPESLASSYPQMEGLDRALITSHVLATLKNDLGIMPSSYGIVGHSLGCGTVMTTGNESWTRVCIAGFPSARGGPTSAGSNGPVLILSSVNDGAVSIARIGSAIPSDYVWLDEANVAGFEQGLPRRAVLLFDRPDAPNHISFLADCVNESMINFLSPLLPLAQALSLPVLDFDKYNVSRDSRKTADVIIPLISSYVRQNMT